MVGLTIGAVDAGVLVVAQEEAVGALTFVAPHSVDADLLAAPVVVLTLVHVYQDGETQANGSKVGKKKKSVKLYGQKHLMRPMTLLSGM